MMVCWRVKDTDERKEEVGFLREFGTVTIVTVARGEFASLVLFLEVVLRRKINKKRRTFSDPTKRRPAFVFFVFFHFTFFSSSFLNFSSTFFPLSLTFFTQYFLLLSSFFFMLFYLFLFLTVISFMSESAKFIEYSLFLFFS